MPRPSKIDLSAGQREHLRRVVSTASTSRPRVRARILLLAERGCTAKEIAAELGTSRSTVERVRRRLREGGAAFATVDRARPGATPLLDEGGRAALAALTVQPPPAGRRGWSMQLLADELVRRGIVDRISDESVRRAICRMRRAGSS